MEQDNVRGILEYLKRIEERLEKIEERLSGNKKIVTPALINKNKSFVEFYLEHKSKNALDKTLTIMDFLEKVRGLNGITTKDISESFKEVREKAPLNISDKIQMLHKKGFIMPGETTGNLKGWIITQIGLTHMEGLKDE